MHYSCVFKDKNQIEHLSKLLPWKKETTISWGNKPVYTNTHTLTHTKHTAFSASVVDMMWAKRWDSVTCHWAVAAHPWFKEKQSFHLGDKIMLVLQQVCMVLIQQRPEGPLSCSRPRRRTANRAASVATMRFCFLSSFFFSVFKSKTEMNLKF